MSITVPDDFRVFEWVSALALFLMGVWIAVFPQTIEVGRFAHVLDLISPQALMFICLIVGALRLSALACDWKPWCPRARAFCAGASAIVWVELSIALIQSTVPKPSIGIPVYISLAIGEMLSVLRARAELNGRIR